MAVSANTQIEQGASGPWHYYLAQMLAALIALLVPVLLLQYAGVGFFGVVAFASVLQACLQLCDLGLSATLTRSCAIASNTAPGAMPRAMMLKSERWVFLSSTLVGVALIDPILHVYQNWSTVSAGQHVSLDDALWWIMVSIVTRNQLELYRGALVGSRQLKWLATEIFGASSFRLVALIGLILVDGLTLSSYYLINIIVNALELVLMRSKVLRLFTDKSCGESKIQGIEIPWRFSFSMVFAAFLWVAFSQTDKIYLSRLWSVNQFAEYSAATLLASGILIITQPLQGIFSTRLAVRYAEGNLQNLVADYRLATRWAGFLIWPLCSVLVFRANDVLRVWTDNPTIAAHAMLVLAGYALGNGLIALGAVNFYLQFALGQLRRHVFGAFLFLVVLVPILFWAAAEFSLDGAGGAWAITNVIFFLTWLPYIHRKLLPFSFWEWLCKDVMPFLVSPMLIMLLLLPFSISGNRFWAMIELGLCYMISALITALAMKECRHWLRQFFRKWRPYF